MSIEYTSCKQNQKELSVIPLLYRSGPVFQNMFLEYTFGIETENAIQQSAIISPLISLITGFYIHDQSSIRMPRQY